MSKSLLVQQLDALLKGEKNLIANLANSAALLSQEISQINWAGYYLYNEDTNVLDLGPFQGKVACMHIEPKSGACGTAFAAQKVQRVANVHEFPGHIACDTASNSEIVLPLTKGKRQIGVLDIDSPKLDRFSAADEQNLRDFISILLKHL